MRSRGFAVVALLAAAGPAAAQVKYPPRPEKFHADLRYSIRAGTDERVRQFRAMNDYLRSVGFVPDSREDADLDAYDPTAETLSGTLPSANAGKLFADPRVRTAIFRPAGTEPPDDPAATVPVRITLSSGLQPADQRRFHEQVVALLTRLGFVENVGYDHHGYAVVRGAIPAGRVPLLLKDLRGQPSGWFLPEIPRDQFNLPLRDILPVRAVEVLSAATPPAAPAPAGQSAPPASLKIAPDLRNVLAEPAAQGKPLFVEAVFDAPIPDGAADLRGLLRVRSPGVTLEGVIGPFAVLRLPSPADMATVARFPEVLALRTPRPAVDTARPGVAPNPEPVLSRARVGELHALGYSGAGARVVVIGTGFAADTIPGAKLIDLTAESSPTLEPAPSAAGPAGTSVAIAARAAAPAAAFTLVRVDPAALHQLATVARSALGDTFPSAALRTRTDELTAESEELDRRQDRVVEEYRQAFADLGDDERAARRREAAQAAVARLQADRQAFRAKFDRLAALRNALAGLRGTDVIVNTLVWEAGYPLDGLSELSRLIDERFTRPPARSALRAAQLPPLPVWVQAASDSAGSVWAGPFLDRDHNAVMEFAPPDAPRPAGTWTAELNFLGVLAADGKATADLPVGAKLRFAAQWREPHDPNLELALEPTFDLTLRLLRQVDPTGTAAATDDMVEVARSADRPVRLLTTAGSGVYEQILEVAVPAAGRYALRIEGRATHVPQIGTPQREAEIGLRLFVRATDPATVAGGRPVFTTFAPHAAGVGLPGDAAAALTVSGDAPEKLLTGAGPGVQLRAKPDLRLPGVENSGLAAGYMGGVSASLVSTGARPRELIRSLGLTPGSVLVLPPEWLRTLTPPLPAPQRLGRR